VPCNQHSACVNPGKFKMLPTLAGGQRGDSRNVLRLLALRAFISIRSPFLTQEWTDTLARLSTEEDWPNPNWASWLDWLKLKSRYVGDPPLKPIVRDPKDDPILALAVSQRANYLVSRDKDFLDLGKPYGVHCISPREFVRGRACILTPPFPLSPVQFNRHGLVHQHSTLNHQLARPALRT